LCDGTHRDIGFRAGNDQRVVPVAAARERTMMTCSHVADDTDATREPRPSDGCAECVASGGRWVWACPV